jgi:FAD synthase
MEPMLGMDFGARYSLIEKKLNINLRLKDAFDTRRFEIYTAEPTYQQHALRDRQSRFLFVGLDYRFGSMKASKKRRKGAPYGDYDDGGGMM